MHTTLDLVMKEMFASPSPLPTRAMGVPVLGDSGVFARATASSGGLQ